MHGRRAYDSGFPWRDRRVGGDDEHGMESGFFKQVIDAGAQRLSTCIGGY
jgi:hypothetical protein